jgi:phosphate transport system permease protein
LEGGCAGRSFGHRRRLYSRHFSGQQPNLTLDAREPASTITAYIVQVSLGDLPHGSIGYQSIFAAGLVLFLMTLIFNIIGFWLKSRFREVYE